MFLFVFALVSLVACKSDTSTTSEDRAVPATTQTNSASTPTTPKAKTEPVVPSGPITSIEFDEDTYDYGEIVDGEKVKHLYKFKNTGDNPLIISNAKGSCGCTVPQWPREPIAPGKSGEIEVVFDSKNKGKVGGSPQSKRVTLTANTDPVNTYLTIKGTVSKPEGAANPS